MRATRWRIVSAVVLVISAVVAVYAGALTASATPAAAAACAGPNNPPAPTTSPTTSPPSTFSGVQSQDTTTEPTTTTTAPPPAHFGAIVTGAGNTGGPHVKVFNAATRAVDRSFFAYDETFRGGVNVALGDVDGDGYQDIVTGAGPGGGPHVKVFSGQTGALIRSFMAYDGGFSGGVFVAACDVNDDGHADIVTGAGSTPTAGPHVKVFDGSSSAAVPPTLASFFAYDATFHGGVRVAAADLDGDGKAEIVTGAGPGGGPHLKAFKLSADPAAVPTLVMSRMVFADSFTGGIFVAASVDAGQTARIAAGSGPHSGSQVLVVLPNGQTMDGPGFTPDRVGGATGVELAIGNVDADGADEIALVNASNGDFLTAGDFGASQESFQVNAYEGFSGGASVAMGVI